MKYYDVWRTRDGRLVPLVDMDDRHLGNTIAMMRRNLADAEFAEAAEEKGCFSSPTVHIEAWIEALEGEKLRRLIGGDA